MSSDVSESLEEPENFSYEEAEEDEDESVRCGPCPGKEGVLARQLCCQGASFLCLPVGPESPAG